VLRATLYFYRGEPVWALEGNGDAGVFRRLVAEEVFPTDTRLPSVPDGTLLESLVQTGRVTNEQVQAVMKVAVREWVLELATAQDGAYEFTEDHRYLDHAPLLSLNPFGLIFESRRLAFSPDQLLAIGSEIGSKFLHPEPGLAVSVEKIKPFLRGLDVTAHVDGLGTVEAFFEKSGLDYIMGTLMVLTMADARLVSFHDVCRTLDDSMVNVSRESLEEKWGGTAAPSIASGLPRLADGHAGPLTEDALAELYQEMMLLTQPAQVLGTAPHVDGQALDSAFQGRMHEFADERIADGEHAAAARAKLAELRAKVQSAYETLKLERPAGGVVTEDSNPF